MAWEKHKVPRLTARNNEIEEAQKIPANDSIGILYSLSPCILGLISIPSGFQNYGSWPPTAILLATAVSLTGCRIETRRNHSNSLAKVKQDPREDRETYGATRAYLSEHLIPARAPEHEITDDHRDVAAALQECLDKVLLHICGHFGHTTGMRRLAMAGGVALKLHGQREAPAIRAL